MTKLHSSLNPPPSQTNTLHSPCPQFRFTKQQRLLKPADFSPIFNDAPIRASHPQFLILARPSVHNQARLGIVVAKKHVKRAVGRNLIKRIVRETFRHEQHKMSAIDAIVLARRGADAIPATELNNILTGLWKRIQKRQQSLAKAE